jgi:4-hydroxy-3-methylbut-2-enyl diphosphate reductase
MSSPAETKYYRASLGLKEDIAGDVSADYHDRLIDALRANGSRLETPEMDVRLAKEFGFCYGVDKAIDMAYEASQKFPTKRIFLTTELIHNPRVNERMVSKGIIFLSGAYKGDLTPDDVTKDDVVLIPAFGVSVKELQFYRDKECIIVDTTCGSVVHVWKRVERYARDGFTSLIHGKYFHEETVATTSHASTNGGHYLVVRNKEQAQIVCDVILGKKSPDVIAENFKMTMSKDFDAAEHLQRIGVANQTTMLASESLEIARMVGDAMKERYGVEHGQEHFRSFDTICSATQDRQDAIRNLVDEGGIDLMLVVGGYNSSNTNHLVDMGLKRCPTYHIDDAREILSATEIRHKPYGKMEVIVSKNWLPEGHFVLGITAGASTPNRSLGETLEKVAALKGLSHDRILAASGATAPGA